MGAMTATLERYAKAIMALLVAAYALYSTARLAGSPGGEGITADEWFSIVLGAITTAGVVWGVPNAPGGNLKE